MSEPLRILIADDHLIVRRGLASILGDVPDMQVVAEASDGDEAVAAFAQHRPDVVLLDLRMPGPEGPDVIASIRQQDPAARVLVLTVQRGDHAALRALKAGALGYLLKDAPATELLQAIRTVAAGRPYIPPALAEQLAAHLGAPELSRREGDVLRLMAAGLANADIAARLGLETKSVQGCVSDVLAKLGARDRTQAVRLALERGVIDLLDLRRTD